MHITLQGILLLKHLLSYKPAKTKPLVFNGKLMSVDFRIKLNNKTKTLIFVPGPKGMGVDSLLMLPMSLKSLCTAYRLRAP